MTNRKSLFAQISDLSKVPGNKGPIVRLCLVAATLIFGLVLTFLALSYTTGGLGDFLIAILTGVLTTILWLWPTASGTACMRLVFSPWPSRL